MQSSQHTLSLPSQWPSFHPFLSPLGHRNARKTKDTRRRDVKKGENRVELTPKEKWKGRWMWRLRGALPPPLNDPCFRCTSLLHYLAILLHLTWGRLEAGWGEKEERWRRDAVRNWRVREGMENGVAAYRFFFFFFFFFFFHFCGRFCVCSYRCKCHGLYSHVHLVLHPFLRLYRRRWNRM